MFDLFRKRSWQYEVLDELRGSEDNLSVRLTHVPCLHDITSDKRKFAWPDFGYDFLLALHDAIGGAKHARACLNTDSSIVVSVQLKQGAAIGVEISGKPRNRIRDFESDIADALISAFGSSGIRP